MNLDIYIQREAQKHRNRIELLKAKRHKHAISNSQDISTKKTSTISLKDPWLATVAQESRVFSHFHAVNFNVSEQFHNHDFFELVYVFSGFALNEVERKQIWMGPGDICLMNTNVCHRLTDMYKNSLIINILINPALLEDYQNNDFKHISKNMTSLLFPNKKKDFTCNFISFNIDKESVPEIAEYLKIITVETIQQKTRYTKIQENAFNSLSIVLNRLDFAEKSSIKNSSPIENSVGEVLAFIKQNSTSITLSNLSKQYNYHPASMSRMIKSKTGRSFSQLLHKTRMESAANYLVSTNMSIHDICTTIGYENRSFFYSLFRKEYGVTPHEYRLNGSAGKI